MPKLVPQPKWFKTDEHLREGDIVLFPKDDSKMSLTYQYGIIKSIITGDNGLIRRAIVRY